MIATSAYRCISNSNVSCVDLRRHQEHDEGSNYPLTITSLDAVEEEVKIKNVSDATVDLTGWKLLSDTGSQSFDFPSTKLRKNATTTVCSGRGGKSKHKPPYHLGW